jgi:hypothetical protein
MIRPFQFEAEIYRSLSCVPMQARRKLDAIGIKIGLDQWQQLSRGERLMICHAPASAPDEIAALRLFIEEATLARSGSKPKDLPEAARAGAQPPSAPPAQLIERARALGVVLTAETWNLLDDDERYALIKLGGDAKPSHNLKAALTELVTSRPSPR